MCETECLGRLVTIQKRICFDKHLYCYLHKWSYWLRYPLSKKVLTSVNFILWFYQCLVLYVRSKTFGKIIWRCFWEGAVYFSLSVSYPSYFSEFILKNLLLSNLEKIDACFKMSIYETFRFKKSTWVSTPIVSQSLLLVFSWVFFMFFRLLRWIIKNSKQLINIYF